MENEIFTVLLTIPFFFLFRWAFKNLPNERWQVLACIPGLKIGPNHWSGINLTYYGLLTATAELLAVLILLILTGSVGIPVTGALTMLSGLLILCVPASGLLARIIEKKKHTLTVGGAFFVGILILPAVIMLTNNSVGSYLAFQIPLMPAMAAAAVAYAFGEGLGRLACISFGCCYGKALEEGSPLIQRIFAKHHFVFSGGTKKISYESGLAGQRVIPIQAVSAVFNTTTAFIGMYLFLNGLFGASFIFTVAMTQSWRVLSETMRKDYRGEGKLSAYQWMSMIAILYALALYAFFSAEGLLPRVHLWTGIQDLWHPARVLSLQAMWLYTFIRSGRSRVTGSTLALCVHEDRI